LGQTTHFQEKNFGGGERYTPVHKNFLSSNIIPKQHEVPYSGQSSFDNYTAGLWVNLKEA